MRRPSYRLSSDRPCRYSEHGRVERRDRRLRRTVAHSPGDLGSMCSAPRSRWSSNKGIPLQMSQHSTSPIKTAHQTTKAFQQCLNPACSATFALDETHFSCPYCGDLIDVVYEWDRLPVPRRLDEFEAKWSERYDPSELLGSLAVPRASPVRAARSDRHDRRRPDPAPARRQGRPVCRPRPRFVVAAIRGHEPFRQLQR